MAVSIQDWHKMIDEMFINMNEQSSEIVYRSYINRSYYAVFHELILAMETVGININQYKTGTHNNLYLILDKMSMTDNNLRKLSLQFRDFLKKRHKADYDLQARISWGDIIVVQKYKKELPVLIKMCIQ